MILGIGIDSVEIARFTTWSSFSNAQLKHIFTEIELNYCLSVPAKSAERFAAHFAAKEACYKALSNAFPALNYSFRAFCKVVEVTHREDGAPTLILDAALTKHCDGNIQAFLSITHTKTTASAIVLIQKLL